MHFFNIVRPYNRCYSLVHCVRIDLCGNYWIKEKLSTPMALKLFCDLYGNSSVGNLDKNSLVITKLFQKKINSVEESYRKQEKETNQQSMIKTILV